MEWTKLKLTEDGNNWWHEDLRDHWYYLVNHKDFDTPMKAKYHNDGELRCFQIVSHNRYVDDVYSWDIDVVTHFMEMPEMPERESLV